MRIVFMGTPLAAATSLSCLLDAGHEIVAVYTQPDRPSGRGNRITMSAVKQIAKERGVLVLQPIKLRTDDALDEFRSHNADVAVVVAYGRILPESFLSAFPLGAINVHFSLLPKYRGAAPVNWAIVNGEPETGVTTMQMDEGLDTGPILKQRTTPIGAEETAPELMDRLAKIGADLLIETLDEIHAVRPIPQDHTNATLAPMLKKEDGRIDWSMTGTDIVNRVRGFQPFPGTYTFANGVKLAIWRASAETEESSNAASGEVVEARADDLRIACGGGTSLRVAEIQPEGKRRMSVRDFLNGFRLDVGTQFGD